MKKYINYLQFALDILINMSYYNNSLKTYKVIYE